MGLILTALFIVVSYVPPTEYYPWLVGYRLELCLGSLALFFSIPNLLKKHPWKLIQTYFWFGTLLAVMVSMIANHWLGGAILRANEFVVAALIFFLLIANCTSAKRLKVLTTLMCAVAVFFVWAGSAAYNAFDWRSRYILVQFVGQSDGSTDYILRMRGIGQFSDPNDLAQYLVVCLALLWLFYEPKRKLRTLIFILLPSTWLLYGMFLTHSRGSIVAVGMVLLFVLRRRFNSVAAAIVTGAAAAAAVALGFTGGRGMSAEEGADRLEAWSQGLLFFKHQPIFGIGMGNFTDRFDITAHNSFVLCFSELGLTGYFCWLGMIVATFLGLRWVLSSNPWRSPQIEPSTAPSLENTISPSFSDPLYASDDFQPPKRDEVALAARVLQLSMIGFLAAAWFLSRAYVVTLYVLLGMAVSVILMEQERHPDRTAIPNARILKVTLASVFASIFLIYVMVRFAHLG